VAAAFVGPRHGSTAGRAAHNLHLAAAHSADGRPEDAADGDNEQHFERVPDERIHAHLV